MIKNKASLYKIKPPDSQSAMRPTNLYSISINLIGFLFVGVALNTNLFTLALIEVPPPRKSGWFFKQH